MVLTNYIPSRKVVAGGVAGITAWAILAVLDYYNLPIPEEWRAILPTLIATMTSYWIPPNAKDVIRRIDDELVALAGKDEKSGISPEVGAKAAQAVSLKYSSLYK